MKIIYPKNIIKEFNAFNCNNLLKEKHLQIGFSSCDLAVIKENGYVIFDFGIEVCGSVRILCSKAEGNKNVRLRFGESVNEACAEIGEKNADNYHSNRDFCIQLQSLSDMTFGNTGFRFLRIDALSGSEVAIKSLVAVCSIDERQEIGAFECDDELVNKIWQTASYTLRLCIQNGYIWDGIKRDRLVWIGDLYPELKAGHCLFGNMPEINNCLEFLREETPVGEWMETIPNYTIWWLLNVCEEYFYSYNKDNLNKHLPYMKEVIKNVCERISKDGNTNFGWDFIDWQTCYDEGEPIEKLTDSNIGTHYLLKITFKRLEELFSAVNEDVSIIKQVLNKLSKKDVKVERYKSISALGILAGDVSDNNKNIVVNGGTNGVSTFMSYFILTAMAKVNEHEKALSVMKDYYGGMLKLGATTFWEDFDLDWTKNACRIDEFHKSNQKDIHGDCGNYCYKGFRHSLCHGWSAGIIAYLIETIAGIKIYSDGKVNIEPNLSGLKWVKAAFPTKDGLIKVEHRLLDNGKVETNIR